MKVDGICVMTYKQGTSDKYYILVEVNNNLYSFYGARKKTMRKLLNKKKNFWEIKDEKMRKGYTIIDNNNNFIDLQLIYNLIPYTSTQEFMNTIDRLQPSNFKLKTPTNKPTNNNDNSKQDKPKQDKPKQDLYSIISNLDIF